MAVSGFTITRKIAASIVALSTSTLLLTACGDDSAEGDATVVDDLTVSPTTEAAPAFEEKDAEPQRDQSVSETVVDNKYNVSYELQSTASNTLGPGTVVFVLVKNLNDVPLPKDALGTPQFTSNGTEFEFVEEGSIKLDYDLGAGASTNLAFAFNAAYDNFYAGEFTIGNVTFKGDINNS